MSPPGSPHRRSFLVHSYEVDPGERLSPRGLCAFLQEAAGGDADALGVSMSRLVREGLAWVLQRLKLEAVVWPAQGATLHALSTAQGDLARARSRWRPKAQASVGGVTPIPETRG